MDAPEVKSCGRTDRHGEHAWYEPGAPRSLLAAYGALSDHEPSASYRTWACPGLDPHYVIEVRITPEAGCDGAPGGGRPFGARFRAEAELFEPTPEVLEQRQAYVDWLSRVRWAIDQAAGAVARTYPEEMVRALAARRVRRVPPHSNHVPGRPSDPQDPSESGW